MCLSILNEYPAYGDEVTVEACEYSDKRQHWKINVKSMQKWEFCCIFAFTAVFLEDELYHITPSLGSQLELNAVFVEGELCFVFNDTMYAMSLDSAS